MSRPDPYATVAGIYDVLAAAAGPAALPDVAAFAGPVRAGMRVLDVGAGTGRVALAVAERAATVCCVEPSADMRSALLAKLSLRPGLWPAVSVHAGSAPDLDLAGDFEYAYLAGCLQFLTPEQRSATLRALARHVRPGGLLALDMVESGPADRTPLGGGPHVIGEARVGGCVYRLDAWLDERTAEHDLIGYRYSVDDGRTREAVTVRRTRYHHHADDVAADLVAAGFAPRTPGAVVTAVRAAS